MPKTIVIDIAERLSGPALVKVRAAQHSGVVNQDIYWDQASVLVQLGLLNPKNLPIAGVETARKAVDETLPSNTIMANWKSSEGKS